MLAGWDTQVQHFRQESVESSVVSWRAGHGAHGKLHGVRVLAVDDEPGILDITEAVRTEAGATVYATSSVADAIAHVASDRPHVVVSDLHMPELSGWDFMKLLRHDAPSLCLVAVSGHIDERMRAIHQPTASSASPTALPCSWTRSPRRCDHAPLATRSRLRRARSPDRLPVWRSHLGRGRLTAMATESTSTPLRALAHNRTLAWLRRERAAHEPELYEYDPDTSPAPLGLRVMTLAESQQLECNRCGQCCGSEDADTGGDLGAYTFGGIEAHQWAGFNGGKPLIIPLTRTGRPRSWRASDGDRDSAPPFRCQALRHFGDGTTGCSLWQSERPVPCNTFPVHEPSYRGELRSGAYVLLNTKFQRLCTWVDTLLCPDDSVLLSWRKADATLRRRLSQEQRDYVDRVFAEAYRDAYGIGDPLALKAWRALRREEQAWR